VISSSRSTVTGLVNTPCSILAITSFRCEIGLPIARIAMKPIHAHSNNPMASVATAKLDTITYCRSASS
jgi:hypothetical protein